MKILLVNTRHFPGGGDSTYTFNLAELLNSHGHQTAFFAMQDERNLPDPNADLFVSQIDFREINRRKSPGAGMRVLLRAIYSVEARRKFRVLLERFQPDLVHLQNIHSHITPSVIIEAKRNGLPVVWTLHDYRMVCPNSHFLIDRTGQVCEACRGGKFYQAIRRRCKKDSLLASTMAALEAYAHRWMGVTAWADGFLTPSQFLRAKLVESGFHPNRVHHMPLFLKTEYFDMSQRDEGYLLFMGRLEAIKGIYVLLEAACLVKDVPLKIAGSVEEPLASRLHDRLPTNAEYVGMQHGKALHSLVRGARAIVSPSICYENQPFSILEGFAAGKPVIASDLGGMTELVAPNDCMQMEYSDEARGLLVKPGDAQELASAMCQLAADPALAQAMGRNAHVYAQQNHSPDKHYQALLKIYSQVGAAV